MKMYYQVQKLKNKQHVLYVKTVKLFFYLQLIIILIELGMQLDDRELFLRIQVLEPKSFEQLFVFVQ